MGGDKRFRKLSLFENYSLGILKSGKIYIAEDDVEMVIGEVSELDSNNKIFRNFNDIVINIKKMVS